MLTEILDKHNLKAEEIKFKITLSDKSGDNDIQATFANFLPNGNVLGAIVDFHIDIINTRSGQVIGKADKIRSYSNSVYAVATNPVYFTDVQEHWSLPFVQLAAAKDLVEGVGAGKYEPDRDVTRAEFTAMLVRALGRGTSASDRVIPHDDVKQVAWYVEAVSNAKELGLLSFESGKSFKPDQPLTRQEMASMLSGAVKLEKLPMPKELASLDDYKDNGSINPSAGRV